MATNTNKRMQELMGLTNNIEPNSRPPTERRRLEPRHSAIQQIDSITGKDKAEARAAEAEAKATERENEITALKTELSKAKTGSRMFPLNRLHKVPGRQRILSAEEHQELFENLRQYPLDTPITLVGRPDGDWDIVSGNNRYDMYVALGRSEIEGVEKEYTEIEATRQAFFSNLLHPSLTDFEKYLGFKSLMEIDNRTQDQIAQDTGITKATVSRIMSFGRLPTEAIELIKTNPAKIGSAAIAEIAQLIESGKREKGLTALADIINNGIEQSAAIENAKTIDRPKPIKEAKEINEYRVKSGKSIYADIRAVDKSIRITLSSARDREVLAKKIHAVIKEHLEAN